MTRSTAQLDAAPTLSDRSPADVPDLVSDLSPRKRCFAPVVDAHTRLLILGSLPGEKSLAQQQYYANRQNHFWPLISALTGVALVPLAYAQRLAALQEQGIGLWDVVAQAQRVGSLDSHIRERDDNDLPGLLSTLPSVAAIAFNGATAARLGMRVLGDISARYRLIALPSSSPAYTLPYAEKLARWQPLQEFIMRKQMA